MSTCPTCGRRPSERRDAKPCQVCDLGYGPACVCTCTEALCPDPIHDLADAGPEAVALLRWLRDAFGVPRCKLCGDDLSCENSNGTWACVGDIWEDDKRVGWKEGRSFVDQHYSDSQVGRKLGDVHEWVDVRVDALLASLPPEEKTS